MKIEGIVGSPPATRIADGTQQSVLQGASGELLVSQAHGKWYQQALAGKVFIGSTLVAGTVIPVNASGLVSTFCLWNPAGSGKNAELIRYNLGLAGTTTAVIASVTLVYQAGLGSAITAPGTLTAITPVAGLIGAGYTPAVGLYSAATHVGTPTRLMTLGLSFGTTGASPGPTNAFYEFDGSVILPPGAAISVTSQSAAQTQAMAQTFIWVESAS